MEPNDEAEQMRDVLQNEGVDVDCGGCRWGEAHADGTICCGAPDFIEISVIVGESATCSAWAAKLPKQPRPAA